MPSVNIEIQNVLAKKKRLILENKIAEARRLLRKSLQKHPTSIEIKEALGQLLNSKRMRNEGILMLEEVLQVKQGRTSICSLACLVTSYFEARRFDDCIRTAQRILHRSESKEKAYFETYVRTQLVMALAFSKAWRKAERAFRLLPSDATLFEDRGYWRYGDIKQLIENGLKKSIHITQQYKRS